VVRTPARVAALACAGFLAAGFALAGCPFETGGLVGASTGSAASSAASSGAASTGTGGHGGAGASSGTAGTGDAGGDAGTRDGSPDAEPVDAGPTAFTSCLDWLTAHPEATSGIFLLRDATGNTYDAYCEMASASGGGAADASDAGDAGDAGPSGPPGGWTLVLKVDGTMGTFAYGNPLWTSADAYHATMPELDMNEAKLASYWSVPFKELRLGMIDGNATRWLIVPLVGTSLLNLVNPGTPTVTQVGNGAWEGLLANGSIQHNCNWQGINPLGRLRIGLIGDESDNCLTSPSADSFIGFGSTGFEGNSPDCGNIARDTPDNGVQTTPTFGYVMVR
jgi:hypothetical protein